MRAEDPDSALAQEFERLKDAHSATMTRGLEWSENPACFERHLKRKHNNPLFPEPDREVTQEQIDRARERDREDAAKLERDLADVASDLQKLPALARPRDVAPIRERIDELLDRAAAIGGQADLTRGALHELRKALINNLRKAFKGNGKLLNALEEAERYHCSRVEIFHDPPVAQLLRIPSSDLIPAMLSESPEIIEKIMCMVDEDKREPVAKEACGLLKSALAQGKVMPLAEEKLKAINGRECG
jgi:hypothetical protein